MPEVEEETQEVETVETSEQKLSYEELEAELGRVRREAAGRRVKGKEQEEQLAEYAAWKESQMSELEKAKARASALEQERRQDFLDLAQAKYGLDEDDLEFITGATKEQILSQAEKLSKRLAKEPVKKEEPVEEEKPRSPNFFPGRRGTPVGSKSDNPNDALRARLQGRF